MKRIISLALCFLLAFTLCQPAFAAGDTITWTGESSNNWNVAGNWNPAQVPADGDYVIIPASSVVEYVYDGDTSVRLNCAGDLTVSNGTLNLTNTSLYENSSLTNGKLDGAGDITITEGSNLLWNGGSIEGSGKIIVENNANLYATPSSLDRYLVNNGSLLINGSSLRLIGGAEGSGNFSIQQDKTLELGGNESYNLSSQVNNMGTLKISDSCTSVQFSSGYTQQNTGALEFDIGGLSDFTQLEVTGNANLNGELKLNILDGYAPQPDDTFEIMTYSSRTGEFSSIISNMEGITLVPAYTATGLTLTVSDETAPEENICEIGENKYTTLAGALAAVQNGETIRLLETINYNSGIVIEDKRITFDLNGFTLNVVNNAEADTAEEMSGLFVIGDAAVDLVDLSGAGELNVTGSWYGVYAASTVDETDSVTNKNTSVTVTNALGHKYAGVMANNAKVTVKGNAASDAGGYGASANFQYAEVTVEGNVTASGNVCVGILPNSSAKITVKGSVTVSGYNSRGIEAYDDGEATVEKDITASGTGSVGINAWGSYAAVGGNVTGEYGGIYALGSGVDITGDVRSLGVEVNSYGVTASNNSDIDVGGDVRSNGTGANIWSEDAKDSSEITIDGVIEAPEYIQIGTQIFAFTEGYLDPEMIEGYRIYADPSLGAVLVAEFAGGSGIEGEPYLVAHADQLYNVRNHLDKHFKLIENIDLSGYSTDKGWEPIGGEHTPFTGAFDGDGHTISGLVIKRPVDPFIGLFANIGLNAKIRNVGLINVNVTGYNHVGGLAGRNRGQITNSYAIGNVTGEAETGGLVGENSGPISDSHAQGTVTDKYGGEIGGLVGENTASGTITNCYANVKVIVTGNTSYGSAGGLVGYNFGGITKSYAVGAVVGRYRVGGLAGTSTGTIDKSYATGTVTGTINYDTKVGGLVGHNDGSINNSFARGDVSGKDKAGGLVGYNKSSITSSNEKSSITDSYATGAVSGDSYIGGLAGYNHDQGDFAGIITNCYWNKETSLQNTSAGGTGKTTAEMKQQATFENWDFITIWDINASDNNGYPFLAVLTAPTAPQNFTATPSDGQVALSWEAPASNGGAAISGYEVSQDNGATWVTASTNTSHTFTGLTNGTAYTFKVRAVNSAGNGAEASVSATPAASTGGEFAPGSGDGTTPETAFLIATPEHLNNVRNYLGAGHTNKHFKLSANLNLDVAPYNSGEGWEPIGTSANPFTGNFDGDGHIIDNLFIKQVGAWNVRIPAGLFGYTGAEAEIRDLMLEDADVTGCYYVGSLVGNNSGKITNVSVSGNVTGEWDTGGLVGLNTGSITGSGFTGNVTGDETVEYGDWTGGLVGYNVGGTITKCQTYVIVVSGGLYVGGLVGESLNGGIITESCSAGTVTAGNYTGGLVGDNSDEITACYSICTVSGGVRGVGGLVGGNCGPIRDSFAAGTVEGTYDVGGLVGSSTDVIGTGCYWDTEASGQSASAGGTGKLTAEMKEQATYENWNFITVWDINTSFNNGYPFLRWQNTEAVTVPDAPQSFAPTLGDGQVALSWTAPASDGGSAIIRYEVSSDNGGTWVTAATNTSHTFTGLTNGTEYTFKVRAVNSVGNGEEASAAATPIATPTPTYTVTVTKGAGGGEFAQGFTVTITANAAPDGQQFKEWQVISGGITLVNSQEASTSFQMPANAVEVTATYETIPETTYTVTVNGSYAGTSGAGQYAPGAQVSIHAGSRSNYSFTGWTSPDGVPFANVNNATTTFIMPAKNVTVTANWSYNGGGSSTPTTPTAPAYKADVKAENGTETTLPVTVDKDTGTASVDAGSQGLDQGGTIITIPPVPDVDTYSVGIPVPDLSTSDVQGTLTVNTDAGSVTVPSNMLTGVSGVSGSKAEIAIGQGDKDNLPDAVKAAIGGRPLVQLTLSIDGKRTDWSNPDAPVTVSIPYTPTAAELANPESIVVWYIDGSGNVVSVPNGRYDPTTGMVTFTTTHFSDYAVVYNKASFNDVTVGAWYHKAISFIAARGITGGTGNGNYSPEVKLTRGQFIVMLMKAYGIAPDADPKNNFADAGATYYTGYLAAAKRLSISNGVGNNMFAPEKEITRQEMFTLLYNALKVIGQLPQGDSDKTLDHFSDAGQIDSWAKEAMTLLVKTGTIGGNAGKLNPTNTTTRAEMAQVLYNLLSK